jgi:uncharacterized membrane protein
VDVDQEGDDAVDTATLLHGDCCICLQAKATQAIVPCGHLALCDECAPEVRTNRGTCPICRRRIYTYLRVFVPGGSKEEELEKAISRCREAEKRARDLEAQIQKPPKRQKSAPAGKQDVPTTKKKTPDSGFWVKMPTLSARNAEILPSPEDVQHSQQCGKVVSVKASTCVVQFMGADEDAYIQHGRIQPGSARRGVELPIDFPFQAVHTAQEAEDRISEQDRYCVFTPMRDARKKKLQSERRAEQRRSKAAAVDVVT